MIHTLAVVALGCVAVLGQTQRAFSFEASVRSEPSHIAPFSLVDHSGQPFTNTSLHDHWTLFAIGFTSCPDVCPMTLSNLALVLEDLSTLVSPDKLPKVVFLAVDPERDKPILGQYVGSFNPNFIGVTGEVAQIGALVEGLDGFYRIVPSDNPAYPEVQHSAAIGLVDPKGHLAAGLNPPLEPARAAAFIADLIRKRSKTVE